MALWHGPARLGPGGRQQQQQQQDARNSTAVAVNAVAQLRAFLSSRNNSFCEPSGTKIDVFYPSWLDLERDGRIPPLRVW